MNKEPSTPLTPTNNDTLPIVDRAVTSLEAKGVPRPFLNCTMAAAMKYASTYAIHPSHMIRQFQNAPESKVESSWLIVKRFAQNGQLMSLWRGVTTAASKMSLREFYKFYGITEFKRKLTEEWLPQNTQKTHPELVKTLTATAISLGDVGFCSPFDRIVNMKVTHEKNTGQVISTRAAYQMLPQGQRIAELYAGYRPYFVKQSIHIYGIIALHERMMEQLKKHQIATTSTALLGDAAIGVAMSPVLNPLDVIRHQRMSIKPIPYNGIIDAAKHIYKQQGSHAFMVGTPQRIVGNIINTAITGGMMNYVDARCERDKNRAHSAVSR